MDLSLAQAALNSATAPQVRELHLVDPAELGRYWVQVRAGVERVAEESSDGWLPEDMYMAIKQGVSLLLVGYVENYYTGFVVLTPSLGWSGPQMHLWALYNRGARDTLETFLPDLLRFARDRGAQKITMASVRKGWDRRAAQLGFARTQTHYALEV